MRKNVLIVGPQGYSQRLRAAFAGSDLDAVAVPLIETVIPDDLPDMDALFADLGRFAYVSFSSRRAIESFARRHDAGGGSLDGVQFLAIGKDSDYLVERLGVGVALEPDEPSPMGIAHTLARQPGTAGTPIAALVPHVEHLAEPAVVPEFLAELTRIGMDVTRVNAYVTRSVGGEEATRAARLISDHQVDAVAFTSGAEVDALLLAVSGPAALSHTTIACFGPYTAAHARKQGVDVDIVGQNFASFAGFLTALTEYYAR